MEPDASLPPSKTRLPLAILVAMTERRIIGCGDRLPWDIPEDLALFRKLTLGTTVIMGHATFQAIGRPLDQRINIVLSRKPLDIEGVLVCDSFAKALTRAEQLSRPVFFIGGAAVYRQALRVVDQLHISWIKADYPGDRYFPNFDLDAWTLIDQRNFQQFIYTRYVRKAA